MKDCSCDIDKAKSYSVHHYQFCLCASVLQSFPSRVRDHVSSAIIPSQKSGSSSLYCYELVDGAVREVIPS